MHEVHKPGRQKTKHHGKWQKLLCTFGPNNLLTHARWTDPLRKLRRRGTKFTATLDWAQVQQKTPITIIGLADWSKHTMLCEECSCRILSGSRNGENFVTDMEMRSFFWRRRASVTAAAALGSYK